MQSNRKAETNKGEITKKGKNAGKKEERKI